MFLRVMWLMTAGVVGFMAGRISMYGLWETEEEGTLSAGTDTKKPRWRRKGRGAEDNRQYWSVGSPVSGEVIGQEEGEHPAVVIYPGTDQLYAPANGKITRLFPMGNAFCFRTEFGAELYIRAGKAEDDLLSGYYRSRVIQNEVVEKGKLLLEFDRKGLEEEGVSPEVTICVERFPYGGEGRIHVGERVTAGGEFLQILEPEGQMVATAG